MNCQHCHIRRVSRPRNLCWACYDDFGIRDQYEFVPREGKAVPDAYRTAREPAEPTQARPGTAEKVDVMVARAEAGESVFHPDDA